MTLMDVRFVAHCGRKSDIVGGPKSADFVAKVGYGGWMRAPVHGDLGFRLEGTTVSGG
jgi:hypothetical protein